MAVSVAVSCHGYGDEGAFDHRAERTGHIVLRTRNGKEFLSMISNICRTHGPIIVLKVFCHSYPRGLIMTDWSGFYDERGSSDTDDAAYIGDLAGWIQRGDIAFAPGATIILIGCDVGGSFARQLSAVTRCTVIGPEGSSYPEVWGNRESGIFIATEDWKVYNNGSFSHSAGSKYHAW